MDVKIIMKTGKEYTISINDNMNQFLYKLNKNKDNLIALGNSNISVNPSDISSIEECGKDNGDYDFVVQCDSL